MEGKKFPEKFIIETKRNNPHSRARNIAFNLVTFQHDAQTYTIPIPGSQGIDKSRVSTSNDSFARRINSRHAYSFSLRGTWSRSD